MAHAWQGSYRVQALADAPDGNAMCRNAGPPRIAGTSLLKGTAMNTTTTATRDVITSDRVEGTSVYNPSGDKLGSIDYLVIDKRSGQVRHAVLEFGGFLGMGSDRYPIPWSMLRYDTDFDGYVVPLERDKLERAPKHSVDARPDYDEDYGREVYGYYGVNW